MSRHVPPVAFESGEAAARGGGGRVRIVSGIGEEMSGACGAPPACRTVLAPAGPGADSRVEERMVDERQDGAKLQVAGAKPQDVGTGTARLSRKSMQQLGIREGAVIEITGKRPTAALALPPYAEDEGLD